MLSMSATVVHKVISNTADGEPLYDQSDNEEQDDLPCLEVLPAVVSTDGQEDEAMKESVDIVMPQPPQRRGFWGCNLSLYPET